MTYLFIKTLLTLVVIITVTEIAKKSSLLAALLISLPLTSILAFIWIYWDTKNIQKIIDLSFNTIIMVIPSFIFFITLPIMLKLKINFTFALLISLICTSIGYYIFINILKKYGISF